MHKSFEILLINIWTARFSNSAMRRYWTIASLSSPCTSQHKHEQKDKTKTLVKFPNHVFVDFVYNHILAVRLGVCIQVCWIVEEYLSPKTIKLRSNEEHFELSK